MAYTNAIFHIKFVGGNDAARTALTTCTASNPSGTITRINKTAHGLVTGAVVDLTLFSAWLNNAFKITVVDANNFDLDATIWQATADNNGTVTPRGGMNWADAWATITSGPTAARIQPGDEFRVEKTVDAASLGQNATFTQYSSTVTLTTAVTKKIEDAVTSAGWTASANITLGTNATRKFGANALTVTPAGGFTTGKAAYSLISGGGTQNFSGYQYLNFWVRPIANNAIVANTWRICLCSDTTGDTIVNAFNVPAISAITSWHAFSIDLGSAMGASIQSVAIYAVVDPGTVAISINNIFAGNSTLGLNHLIGKSDEVYYTVQSIDGTTVKIDTSSSTTAASRGHTMATSTEAIYTRLPFMINQSTTWQTVSEAGNALSSRNHYSGGWDTGTNTRIGTTVFGNNVDSASTIVMSQHVKFSYFTFARFGTISPTANIFFDNVVFACCGIVSTTNIVYATYTDCTFLNSSGSIAMGGNVEFTRCRFENATAYGISYNVGNNFLNCIFSNNGSGSLTCSVTNRLQTGILRNCVLSDATEINMPALCGNMWSYNHDDTLGNHRGFFEGGSVSWQTSVFQGSDPGSWMAVVTSNVKAQYFPLEFILGEVACTASSLVTVKVWVKKDHATNIAAGIKVQDAEFNLIGITETLVTKANDTNWEELTLTFTPSEAGIVPIIASAWYVGASSNVYFGSITVTQA